MGEWRARGGNGTCPRLLEVDRGCGLSLWSRSVLGAPAGGVWWRVATLWDGWGCGAGMAMLARRDLGDARLDWRRLRGCVWDVRRGEKRSRKVSSQQSRRKGETYDAGWGETINPWRRGMEVRKMGEGETAATVYTYLSTAACLTHSPVLLLVWRGLVEWGGV